MDYCSHCVVSPAEQEIPFRSALIVDDHAVVREGLMRMLAARFPAALFGEAENSVEAVTKLQQRQWDLLLLDMEMPGGHGLEVLRHIASATTPTPRPKVLVLTANPDPQLAMTVLQAGAHGFVTKSGKFEFIVAAVRAVLSGKRYISPEVSQDIVFTTLQSQQQEFKNDTLSKREFQVLLSMATGKSVKEIAADLGVSVKTVSTYRARMFDKLNFKTTADLVRYAVREGIVRV